MLRQETCKKERKVPVTPPVVASNTGLENQYLLPVDSTQTQHPSTALRFRQASFYSGFFHSVCSAIGGLAELVGVAC